MIFPMNRSSDKFRYQNLVSLVVIVKHASAKSFNKKVRNQALEHCLLNSERIAEEITWHPMNFRALQSGNIKMFHFHWKVFDFYISKEIGEFCNASFRPHVVAERR